jgi:hypothetical protein
MPSIEKARAALAANPLPSSPWLEVTDDVIIIRAGFSEQLLQLLRWVPKVEWRPEKRYWTVPLSGAEIVRMILPEIQRLAELTQPRAAPAESRSVQGRFRAAARLLYGSDWQRETARALKRNEAELARWLAGDLVLEDSDLLLVEMLALMRQRANEISEAADRLAEELGAFD